MTHLRLCTFLIPIFLSGILTVNAQSLAKKQLEIEDLTRWNNITSTRISNDGRWVVYTLDAEDSDPTTFVYDGQQDKTQSFERADDVSISHDNQYMVFMIHPAEENIRDMRRRKVDKNDLPGDTLAILNLMSGKVTQIPEVKGFQLPEKWSGWLTYLTLAGMPTDSTQAKKAKKSKKKTYDRLVIRNLSSGEEMIADQVEAYEVAEAGSRIAWVTEGQDSTIAPGVYWLNPMEGKINPVFRAKGTFKHLTFDEKVPN